MCRSDGSHSMSMRWLFPALLLMWSLVGAAPSHAGEAQYLHVAMRSSVLTQFWGQPVSVEAHVLLPDSFYKEPQKRYPIFYWIQGFGGDGQIDLNNELSWQRPMRRLHTEFIVMFLNGMFNDGHQEFADSANNGPWGTALTTEFIPETEKRFRAMATAETRFVGGNSSGGWSALWLQLRGLGSDAEIDFAPGANHFTVFDWNGGAIDYIIKEAASPGAIEASP